MTLHEVVVLTSEIGMLAGLAVPVFIAIHRISNGVKCQLRSEMLRIYYHNREKRTIRQYEYENFVKLYGAYKALKGNSFIDKIYREVQEWDIIP